MRLVRDHRARVLIVGRGKPRYHWLMWMPAGYLKFLARDDFLEMHETTPIVPLVRVLGGGSSVNAMVDIRSQREDYDSWDAFIGHGSGWSYDDMLPHFRGLEHNTKFNDTFHGIGDGLDVSDTGRPRLLRRRHGRWMRSRDHQNRFRTKSRENPRLQLGQHCSRQH